MIDKPQDKFEYGLTEFTEYCTDMKHDIGELLRAGGKEFGSILKRLPYVVIPVIIIFAAFSVYFIVQNANLEYSVFVNVRTAGKTVTTEYVTKPGWMYEIPERYELDYDPEFDLMTADLNAEIQDGSEITIDKAFDVTVKADGNTYTVKTLGTDVASALNELGIKTDFLDIVEPEKTAKIVKPTEITVHRVKYGFEYSQRTTRFTSHYTADPSMTIGKVEVTQEGQKGIEESTYCVRYEDGVETDAKFMGTEVLQKARDTVVSYGTKILSGTPSDLKYVDVIKDVKAVSYYFSGNPHGAYGGKCTYGTCAVDPDVIPLGSLIYVEGYGYAIANDTGSGVKGNMVDLYMEKLSQCAIWGARWTTVYVVRYGPG